MHRASAAVSSNQPMQIGRRAFLHRGALVMSATAATPHRWLLAEQPERQPALRLGMLTDLHYADKPPAGTRHYRESLTKIREAVAKFNDAGAAFAVEIGDFVDAADDVKTEIGYLETIEAEFAMFKGDRHYVLGNHCVWSLTKEQFLDHCAARKSFYSFDRSGFHFVVLDACFRKDGVPYGAKNFEWTDTEIPPQQREWLAADLAETDKPTLAFVHQRLDVSNHYAVHSAPAVRKILAESGKVLAVFQGHNHINEHKEIDRIHYCTLGAVVEGSGAENNAYSLLDAYEDGTLALSGFRQHVDRTLERTGA